MNSLEHTVLANFRKYFEKWEGEKLGRNQASFAKQVEVSPATISFWLNKQRAIPEQKHTKVAEVLGISVDDLRQPLEEMPTLETAYVLVSYRGLEAGRSIDLLKHAYDLDAKNIVKEAATVYGDKGGLLKLQALTQNEIGEFLIKIAPYCDSTTTMFVMSGYQWQRQQDENLRILEKINHDYHPFGDVVEKIEEIRRWIAASPDEDNALVDYFDDFFKDSELKDALNGKLRITDPDKLMRYPILLARNVKTSLCGLAVWDQRTIREKARYETYLAEQKKLLNADRTIEIKRVFITPTMPLPDDLCYEMRRQKNIGIQVSYMPYEKWRATRAHISKPLDFGLFDETFLWIHDELVDTDGLRNATLYALKKSDEMIARYKRLFEANWAQSVPFDES